MFRVNGRTDPLFFQRLFFCAYLMKELFDFQGLFSQKLKKRKAADDLKECVQSVDQTRLIDQPAVTAYCTLCLLSLNSTSRLRITACSHPLLSLSLSPRPLFLFSNQSANAKPIKRHHRAGTPPGSPHPRRRLTQAMESLHQHRRCNRTCRTSTSQSSLPWFVPPPCISLLGASKM